MTKIDLIAQVCHEANRAYCLSIGDDSQPVWEEAPDWQKKSAKEGVKYHLNNPNSQPEDSHNSWLEAKQKDGWKYGEEKDPENKLHPCIMPFNKLPIEQQRKDEIFVGIVRAMESVFRPHEEFVSEKKRVGNEE